MSLRSISAAFVAGVAFGVPVAQAHHSFAATFTDEIIVVEGGRITQRGSHDELVTKPGYYCELNTMQQIEREMEADS